MIEAFASCALSLVWRHARRSPRRRLPANRPGAAAPDCSGRALAHYAAVDRWLRQHHPAQATPAHGDRSNQQRGAGQFCAQRRLPQLQPLGAQRAPRLGAGQRPPGMAREQQCTGPNPSWLCWSRRRRGLRADGGRKPRRELLRARLTRRQKQSTCWVSWLSWSRSAGPTSSSVDARQTG